MCVFCNQRYISGVEEYNRDEARKVIEEVLSEIEGKGYEAEIAFFGGSFTGIDRSLMISLLDMAEAYVEKGLVSGIRMSTRPDYISKDIIDILDRYTVNAVELGIQSLDDEVLKASKRGHTADDSKKAIGMLKDAGYVTVGQMMIGLPHSTREKEIRCAEEICKWGVSGTRIYPTIVFKGTELSEMMTVGKYTPLTLEDAVMRSADVYEVFLRNKVDCLRIGLCDSDVIHSEECYSAGPNHPSIGELVYSEIYFRRISGLIKKLNCYGKNITVSVPSSDVSMAVGQHHGNRDRLISLFGLNGIKFVKSECTKRFDVSVTVD